MAGQPTTFKAQWSSLATDARYLGVLEYECSLGPTIVHVDTSTP
ncbi:MAG: hypothetical protein QOK15_3464 [Nocardioidaceae bacterium]|nr:hypothetical protein [Nocardioidaceae bacterium]